MSELAHLHDFVEVDYTGTTEEGQVFDTTEKLVATEHHLHSASDVRELKPACICIGEHQLLPGLDEALVGKEVGKPYTAILPPEKAFGKRDIKKLRIIPASTFQEHQVQPHPGLQVQVDGETGTISRIAGGRIMVNFNHPLAGKQLKYAFTIRRKITDQCEQIKTYLHTTLSLPPVQITVNIKEGKGALELPVELPPQLASAISKKLQELVHLSEITFSSVPSTVPNTPSPSP